MTNLLAQELAANGAARIAHNLVLHAQAISTGTAIRSKIARQQAAYGATHTAQMLRALHARQPSHGIVMINQAARMQVATGAIHIVQLQHARHPAAIAFARQEKLQPRAHLTAVQHARLFTIQYAAVMAEHTAMNARQMQQA
jgi:hypothetical protein